MIVDDRVLYTTATLCHAPIGLVNPPKIFVERGTSSLLGVVCRFENQSRLSPPSPSLSPPKTLSKRTTEVPHICSQVVVGQHLQVPPLSSCYNCTLLLRMGTGCISPAQESPHEDPGLILAPPHHHPQQHPSLSSILPTVSPEAEAEAAAACFVYKHPY